MRYPNLKLGAKAVVYAVIVYPGIMVEPYKRDPLGLMSVKVTTKSRDYSDAIRGYAEKVGAKVIIRIPI